MRGAILGVHDGRGVIAGPDETRYEFPLSEWRTPGLPASGQIVDFVLEDGQVKAVFPVPGAALGGAPGVAQRSESFVLGVVAVICLALGFVIPLVPTIAALIVGAIGAGRARAENDSTGLLLCRIGWIGALVLLLTGLIALGVVMSVFGGVILAALAAAAHDIDALH